MQPFLSILTTFSATVFGGGVILIRAHLVHYSYKILFHTWSDFGTDAEGGGMAAQVRFGLNAISVETFVRSDTYWNILRTKSSNKTVVFRVVVTIGVVMRFCKFVRLYKICSH